MYVTEPLVIRRVGGTRPALPVGGPPPDPFTPPAKPIPLALLRPRTRAEVAGTVATVAEERWAGGAVVEVTLTDGTGSLLLAFTGRRALAGALPGGRLAAAGMVVLRHGRPMLMNPCYWLLPTQGEART